MKNKTFLWSLLLGLLFVYSCSDDTPGLSVDLPEGASVVLEAQYGADSQLSFHASQAWTSKVETSDDDDVWLQVSPASGEAGDHKLTLSVISPNDTGGERTATLTLMSGDSPLQITVRQEEYIRLDETTYQVSKEGGDLDINFHTTIAQGDFGVYSSANVDWITDRNATATRVAESSFHISLRVAPNEGNQSRSVMYYFVKEPIDKTNLNPYILATATLVQAGQNSGTSEDYGEDGKVVVLQEHTVGDGIPLVLMGDGFIDTEIESGYYEEVMDKAVENLFTEYPISEMRDYFDIYCVKVVSSTNVFGTGETALGCWMDSGTSTTVGGDHTTVQDYVKKVEGIDLENTQVVVILNSDAYKGSNYFFWYDGNNTPLDFCIAYFSVIDNLESEDFRRVLVHETVGHGIGKLQDEYAYEENPVIPDDEITQLRQQQEDFGWWLNVDFTDDPQEVLWSDFLSDTRYEDQGLGLFEGGATYLSGVWRPTKESMMNGNTPGFNAPSRRAIYTNIIKRGEGRTPDLEEFIDFDQRTYVAPTQTRAATPSRPFARPQVVRLDRPLGE